MECIFILRFWSGTFHFRFHLRFNFQSRRNANRKLKRSWNINSLSHSLVEFNKNENSYTLYVEISENITLSTTFFENFRASFENLQAKFVNLAKVWSIEEWFTSKGLILPSYITDMYSTSHSDSSKAKKTSISRVVLCNLLNRIWARIKAKYEDFVKYQRLSIKRFRQWQTYS